MAVDEPAARLDITCSRNDHFLGNDWPAGALDNQRATESDDLLDKFLLTSVVAISMMAVAMIVVLIGAKRMSNWRLGRGPNRGDAGMWPVFDTAPAPEKTRLDILDTAVDTGAVMHNSGNIAD